MRTLACTLTVLALASAGCTSSAVEELFLSQAQQAALESHVQTTADVQEGLASIGFLGAYGELSLAEYAYDPPTAQNGFVGTLTRTGPFAFGTGTATILFTAEADGTPVDPFAVDLDTYNQVDLSVQADFDGDNLGGEPVQALADFDVSTVPDGTDVSVATVGGDFDVFHDGHASMIDVNGLQVTYDRSLGEMTDVIGDMSGRIEIPDFPFDGILTAQGLGDEIEFDVDASLSDVLVLFQL